MSNNQHKRYKKSLNNRKEPTNMIPEVTKRPRPKQQKFFDKYRTKLLTAAAVLTFATPAAITAVQNGEFNPLEAIQAVSGEDVSKDDISKKIVALSLNLLDSAGTEVGTNPVNPYSQYLLELKTSSLITVDTLKIGDFFYINLPKELDYSAVDQMGQDTQDFPYSLTVIHEGEEKKLRVEIKNVSNFPTNAFKTEMQLPVTIINKEDQTIKLTASTIGGGSSNQEIHIKKREIKDISNSTTVAMEVYNPTNNEPINREATVSPYDSLGFKLTFTPEDTNLLPGDYFTVNLPTQMEYAQDTEVNYYSPEMQFVGTIDNVTKTMKCTILRVSQIVAPIEAMGIKVVAPFDSIRLPQNGGDVSLVASTEKNSISHEIKLTAIEGKRDISNEVESLSFVLYDEQGQEVSSGSKVNPYKVYGMDIDIDMGTNKFNEQVAPGDYVDVKLPDVLNFDYVNEMVNDTPTFKSVGRIIRKDGGTYLRTTIERVPRAASNTVALKFKLHIPFNVNKLFSITEVNGVRIVPLILSTTNLSTPNFNVKVHNLGNPEVPNNGGEYASPHNRLFYQANFTDVLRAEYIGSEFWQHSRKKLNNGEIADRGLYPYSVYTLVKVERSTLPRHDYLAKNVDPTKKHWSASPGCPSESNDSSIPNAGPGNYVNGYCISSEPFTFTTPSAIRAPYDDTPRYGNQQKYIGFNNRNYRYTKTPFDSYFSSPLIAKNIDAHDKDKVSNALKSIIPHSYPFVSEEVMRQYFGFEPDIHLSDMLAATQQIIWNTLGIDPMFEPNSISISSIEEPGYDPNRYTVALTNNQMSIAGYPKDQNVKKALQKMQAKRYKTYNPQAPEDVKILSTSLNEETGELTIYLSRQLDSSETGRLMVSTQGKKSLEQAIDSSRTAYSINVGDLIKDNVVTNRLDINLDITDEDAEVEFYAYSDSADSQDIISCEINPRDYSAQETIKFNRGKFEFKKVVSGTQYTIAGAEFKLTHTTTGHELIAVANKDGIVKFNHLASGKYTLKEISAPSGYVLIEKEYTVTVKENGEVVSDIKVVNNSYEISNPEVKIELIKEDADKTHADNTNRLNGAVFSIDKVNGVKEGYPKQYTTKGFSVNAGEIHFTRLSDGEYTVKEIKAPEGYIKSGDEIKFTVKNGVVTRDNGDILNGKDAQKIDLENKSIYVKNEKDAPKYGKIEITKVDFDSPEKALRGATFILENSATQVRYTQESDDTGKVVFENLPQGDYVLEESKAPEGYDSTDEKWYITITKDGEAKYSKKEKSIKSLKTKGNMKEDSRIDSSNFKIIYPTRDNVYTLVTDTGSDVVSSLDGAFDRNAKTAAIFSPKKRFLGRGDYIGVDFGKTQNIRRIHIKQAPTPHVRDWYTQYRVQYFALNQWFDVNNIVYETNEIDIKVNLNTSKIRLLNQKYKENAWMGLETFEVFGEKSIDPDTGGGDVTPNPENPVNPDNGGTENPDPDEGDVTEPDEEFITAPIKITNKKVNTAKIKITKIDAQTEETIIDNNHKTNARFGITTTPNPVANDDLSSKDIINGQAGYLDNGTVTFDNDTVDGNDGPGFKPGQYYLWEMRAPKGYAKLLDVIPFYITESGEVIMPSKQNENGEYVLDEKHPAYNMITIEGSDDAVVPTYSFKVKNRKAEYPKTGSIGSIIFYVIGLMGMIGSAWMVTKKQ